jgi:hypothetical protein
MIRERLRNFIKRQSKELVVFFVAGFFVALGMGGYYAWTQYFISHAKTATATITDSRRAAKHRTVYTYRFFVDGKEYTFNESDSLVFRQERGGTYPVYYDPSDPSNATNGHWEGFLVWACAGLLTMMITLTIALRNREKPPREKKPHPGADVI